jgi:glycerophosphoryl diester phosphodiesterase
MPKPVLPVLLGYVAFLLVMDPAAAQIGGGPPSKGGPRVLVAHRGASAYAPEHTLAAYKLALEQGADFVEQDLALTKDGALVCLHDPSLERTTDIETRFPDRFTAEATTGTKRWLAIDFTLAEIKTLDAGSWFDPRFAGERVPTFEEAVALVRGKAGLFPELKVPSLYASRGVSMEKAIAGALTRLNLVATARSPRGLILQSFDADSLKEMARLLPDVPRVFLLEPGAAATWLSDAATVRTIAAFASGIGPNKAILDSRPEVVRWAHDAGLTVTPYTFRSRATGRFPSVAAEMSHYLYTLGVDALFTDNPDQFPRTPRSP